MTEGTVFFHCMNCPVGCIIITWYHFIFLLWRKDFIIPVSLLGILLSSPVLVSYNIFKDKTIWTDVWDVWYDRCLKMPEVWKTLWPWGILKKMNLMWGNSWQSIQIIQIHGWYPTKIDYIVLHQIFLSQINKNRHSSNRWAERDTQEYVCTGVVKTSTQ